MRHFSCCECKIFNALPKFTWPLIYQSALMLRYQADNVVFFVFLLKNCSVPNKFLTVGENGRSMWNAPSVGKSPQCRCGQVLLEVNGVHPCSDSAFGVLNSY